MSPDGYDTEKGSAPATRSSITAPVERKKLLPTWATVLLSVGSALVVLVVIAALVISGNQAKPNADSAPVATAGCTTLRQTQPVLTSSELTVTGGQVVVTWRTSSKALPPGSMSYTATLISRPQGGPAFGVNLIYRDGSMVSSEVSPVDESHFDMSHKGLPVTVEKAADHISATYPASSFPGLTSTFGWSTGLIMDYDIVSICPGPTGVFANYP